jgi:hypothetical protein
MVETLGFMTVNLEGFSEPSNIQVGSTGKIAIDNQAI